MKSESTRPYRLWDAKLKQNVRWRYYADPRRAHMGALLMTGWAAVGTSIEVYDCRNGKLLGQYTRRIKTIEFVRFDHAK